MTAAERHDIEGVAIELGLSSSGVCKQFDSIEDTFEMIPSNRYTQNLPASLKRQSVLLAVYAVLSLTKPAARLRITTVHARRRQNSIHCRDIRMVETDSATGMEFLHGTFERETASGSR